MSLIENFIPIYNKIMLKFWLVVSVVIFCFVTYSGFKEGFEKWAFWYVFGVIAFIMYLMKKWMIKRMAKHIQYLQDQQDLANKN